MKHVTGLSLAGEDSCLGPGGPLGLPENWASDMKVLAKSPFSSPVGWVCVCSPASVTTRLPFLFKTKEVQKAMDEKRFDEAIQLRGR